MNNRKRVGSNGYDGGEHQAHMSRVTTRARGLATAPRADKPRGEGGLE